MTIANMHDAETLMPVAGRQMRNAMLASVLGGTMTSRSSFSPSCVHPDSATP